MAALGIDNMKRVVLNDHGAGREGRTVFQNDSKQRLVGSRSYSRRSRGSLVFMNHHPGSLGRPFRNDPVRGRRRRLYSDRARRLWHVTVIVVAEVIAAEAQ